MFRHQDSDMMNEMKRESIYLDTSVPSAYFDSRTQERLDLTRKFWNETLPGYSTYVSELVLEEIGDTQDQKIKTEMLNIVSQFAILKIDAEVENLAEAYLTHNLLPEKYRSDALHIALASCNNISYIISWNFEHIVKVRTRRIVKLINALQGYKDIEIVSPQEL